MSSVLREFFRGFFTGTRRFGTQVASVVNALLLSVVYFVAIGPTALVARLRRHHFMHVDAPAQKGSFWSAIDVGSKEPERYLRQY